MMTTSGGRRDLEGRGTPVGALFRDYGLEPGCYDEMFAEPPPACRPHYRAMAA